MITEAVILFLVDFTMNLINALFAVYGTPISGYFPIPRPLFEIVEAILQSLNSGWFSMFTFWLYRQIKPAAI